MFHLPRTCAALRRPRWPQHCRQFHVSPRARIWVPKRTNIEVDGRALTFDNIVLRDACTCEKCVHPATQQKLFQTTDIPADVRPAEVTPLPDGVLRIVWADTADHPMHESLYSSKFLLEYANLRQILRTRHDTRRTVLWNRAAMIKDVCWIEYADYMREDRSLFEALKRLSEYGLVFLRGVPNLPGNNAVEGIVERIGNLKNTFYGKTWDVKSVPDSKNIAYTSLNLGLHMDLLYFESPPGVQFLHCIQNSTAGGSSVFADSFRAATAVRGENMGLFRSLTQFHVAYRYRNDGQHYHFTRPTVVLNEHSPAKQKPIAHVNWAPPFQAPFELDPQWDISVFRQYYRAAQRFAHFLQSPDAQFELRLGEGECVIFQNRRVVHSRREFDPASGQRWLKGAYLDIDAMHSKYRVLAQQFGPKAVQDNEGDDDDDYAYIQ